MRFAWVTNVDAPYRRPVWRALGQLADLTVWLTDPGVDRDTAANRGADWATTAGEEYTVHRLPTFRVARGEARYYLPRTVGGAVLRNVDAVLLGGWESPVYWMLAARARLTGVRRVGFYESHGLSRRFTAGPVGRARSAWFRSLDAVLVPGEAAADALRADGVDPSRIVTGFNAVDVHHFAAAASDHTDAPEHRFLVVSQLIPRKQIDLVIAALVQLPGATLTVVGSGPERTALEHQAARLGVADRVLFLGSIRQSALPAVYAGADTLVLPSYEEVWGLVVNEALAAGLGVIVSRTAGVAPSVALMAGVHVVEPTAPAVLEGMRTAAAAWSGPIEEPEILAHTPEAFAADAFRALARHRSLGAATISGSERSANNARATARRRPRSGSAR